MSNILKKFARNKNGSILPLFGLSAVTLMTVAGMAVDFSRNFSDMQNTQIALDSSALAIASEMATLTPEELDEIFENAGDGMELTTESAASGGSAPLARLAATAQNFFDSNIKMSNPNELKLTPRIIPITERKFRVQVEAEGKTVTTFLKLLNKDSIDWVRTSSTTVTVPSVEVAIAADISWSMRNADIAAMKVAMKELVGVLYPGSRINNNRVVSLIPFADNVNFGMQYKSHWLSMLDANTYAPEAYETDFVGCFRPEWDASVKQIRFGIVEPGKYAAMYNTVLSGLPLCPRDESKVELFSSDPNSLNARIDGLNKAFGTGSGIGTMWALRSLLPSWRGKFLESESLPRNFPNERDADLQEKHIIILTDGRPVQYDSEGDGQGKGVTYTVVRERVGKESFVDACDAVKAVQGGTIHVHAIAYRLDPNANEGQKEAYDLLAACINGRGSLYLADENSLTKVFKSIAQKIGSVRLVN